MILNKFIDKIKDLAEDDIHPRIWERIWVCLILYLIEFGIVAGVGAVIAGVGVGAVIAGAVAVIAIAVAVGAVAVIAIAVAIGAVIAGVGTVIAIAVAVGAVAGAGAVTVVAVSAVGVELITFYIPSLEWYMWLILIMGITELIYLLTPHVKKQYRTTKEAIISTGKKKLEAFGDLVFLVLIGEAIYILANLLKLNYEKMIQWISYIGIGIFWTVIIGLIVLGYLWLNSWRIRK
jgi:hypothetical protein